LTIAGPVGIVARGFLPESRTEGTVHLRSCFVGLIVLWGALAGLAQAAVPGDVDCDGRVGEADLTLLAADFFGDGSPPVEGCAGPDANGDTVASAADLVFVMRALGQPVATPTPRSGPVIAFFGIAGFDGTVSHAVTGSDGVPVYQSSSPSGFQVVVEAISGADDLPAGTVVFNSNSRDPTARPDLQIEASQDLGLGDGKPSTCSTAGVPGFDPPDFGMTQAVSDALNVFGCGFGANTNPAKACTIDSFGSPTFVSAASHVVQFCLLVNGAKAFAPGGTTLTAQVRDVGGTVGDTMQILVHVGGQPQATATATPVPSAVATRTSTATRTVTPSGTLTRTPTGTPSNSPTTGPSRTLTPTITGTRPATSTPTRTPSATRSATPSATPSSSRTPSSTRTNTPGSPSATATFSRTPTITPTVTLTRTATTTGTATFSPTVTRTATTTLTGTPTRTPTNTRTPTSTATVTRTPTVTATRTTTRTPTATVPPEPLITFFGVTRSDDTLVDPDPTPGPGGLLVFQRQGTLIGGMVAGINFSLVIEGRPGGTDSPIGASCGPGCVDASTFNWSPTDPTVLPYLLIEASRPLGQNPTALVCDEALGKVGGVPGTDPPDFSLTQHVADVVNDFACHFKDGTGTRNGRDGSEACTLFAGDFPPYHFVNPAAPQFPSTIQFCGLITSPIAFPAGQTTVTARISDAAGHVSAPAQIIISISAPPPTMTPSN
jgi:hypothetical protein